MKGGEGEEVVEEEEEEEEDEKKGEEEEKEDSGIEEQSNRPWKEMLSNLDHQISQVTNLHPFPPSITLLFAPDFYP